MRSSRIPRLARGLVAASIATFVALLSHVTAGGSQPHWVGVVVPLVVSVLVCTVLAGRSLSLLRLSAAVAVSQALFHLLFVLGTFRPSVAASSGPAHDHTAVGNMPMAGSEMTLVSGVGAEMWLAHAAAAVATVAALYRGERAISGLRDVARQTVWWVHRRVALIALPTLISVPRRVLAVSASVLPALSALAVSVSPRRGPPVGCAV